MRAARQPHASEDERGGEVRRACARPRLDKGGLLSKDQTEVTMGFLKHTLTGLLLLAGSVFLYEGLGTNFRILDEGQIDLEPYAIPIGVAFLGFSLLLEKPRKLS